MSNELIKYVDSLNVNYVINDDRYLIVFYNGEWAPIVYNSFFDRISINIRNFNHETITTLELNELKKYIRNKYLSNV